MGRSGAKKPCLRRRTTASNLRALTWFRPRHTPPVRSRTGQTESLESVEIVDGLGRLARTIQKEDATQFESTVEYAFGKLAQEYGGR